MLKTLATSLVASTAVAIGLSQKNESAVGKEIGRGTMPTGQNVVMSRLNWSEVSECGSGKQQVFKIQVPEDHQFFHNLDAWLEFFRTGQLPRFESAKYKHGDLVKIGFTEPFPFEDTPEGRNKVEAMRIAWALDSNGNPKNYKDEIKKLMDTMPSMQDHVQVITYEYVGVYYCFIWYTTNNMNYHSTFRKGEDKAIDPTKPVFFVPN